ncbi:MAG: MFS transporter [Gemmatimonadetes bacterium]|nr:MFS transporter [Gemmatimonadota bacterium]
MSGDRDAMKRVSVLMATAFVDMLGVAMVFPLVPFYALRLEAQPWMIGWIIASFSIAQLTSSPLWGRVSDRYGRRPALLVGLGASAVAFVIFAYAAHWWLLLLSRIVQGAGGGTTGVVQAYVGDAIQPRERAKALGWISASTSAGVMIGPAIGSLLTTVSFEAPGLFAALLCALNVYFAWRWLPESKPGKGGNPPRPSIEAAKIRSVREVVWDVIRRPRGEVPRLVWIYAVGMLGFTSMNAVLALYLQGQFGVTERTIGLFFVYVGGLSLVMRALVLGKMVERFGETGVMRMGSVMMALGLALLPLAHLLPLFALVIAMIPIATALLFPATSALVTHRAPKAELGQVLGVQQTFGGIARVVAPIWATAVFQGAGPSVPFYLASGIVAVVSLLAFRVRAEQPAVEAA